MAKGYLSEALSFLTNEECTDEALDEVREEGEKDTEKDMKDKVEKVEEINSIDECLGLHLHESLTEATDLPDDLLKAYKGRVRRQGDRSDAEKSATARAGFGNIEDKYDKRSEYAFDKASAEEISKEDAKKIFADKKADKSNIHMLSGKGDLITYDEKGKPVHKVDANTSKYAWFKNNDYTFKNASGKDVPSTAYMPVNDVIDQSAKIYKVNLPRTDADTMKARDENPESRKYTTNRIAGGDPGFKHSLLGGNYDDRYASAERGLANYWNKNPEVNLDVYKNGDDYNSLSDLKQRMAKSNIDAAEYDNKAAEADKYAALANAARGAGLDAKDFEKAASRAQNYRDNAKYYRDMANEYANRIQRDKWKEDDYRANRRNFNSEREFLDKEYKLRDLISARNNAEWYKNNAASKLGDESPELKNAKAALANRQAEFDRAQAALRDAQAAHDKWLADDEPRRAKYQKEYDDRAAKYDAAQNDIKNFYHKKNEALGVNHRPFLNEAADAFEQLIASVDEKLPWQSELTFDDVINGELHLTYAANDEESMHDTEDIVRECCKELGLVIKNYETCYEDDTLDPDEGWIDLEYIIGKNATNESLRRVNEAVEPGYEPWGGAVDVYDQIVDAGMEDALYDLLDDLYPDMDLDWNKLNDILWFDGDFILSELGLLSEE